jgi:hypothetical protein
MRDTHICQFNSAKKSKKALNPNLPGFPCPCLLGKSRYLGGEAMDAETIIIHVEVEWTETCLVRRQGDFCPR